MRLMAIEGQKPKQYGVTYGGQVVGSWDTAREALAEYRSYEENIRPVTDPSKKFKYSFRDGRAEISLEQLLIAANARK